MRFNSKIRAAMALACSAITLAACGGPMSGVGAQRMGKFEAPTLQGPMVRDNRTPLEPALACFSDHLAATQRRQAIIGVGEIKDYTGKYSINEGNAVTQGGSLMVYSALGKLGSVVQIAERYDPSIAERELGYTDRRQLGDGQMHDVNGQKVPWSPYFGGTIKGSDYYIVGGITELNYNIKSGGAELGFNNIGGKGRVYNQSVAVDLRIVDSKSLLVVKTVSLTKQFTGYEVGFNIFRFFGADLFDINIGARGQEPLQLGIRATLEEATMRLVGAVTKIDPEPCLTIKTLSYADQSADKLYGRALAGREILNPIVAEERETIARRKAAMPAPAAEPSTTSKPGTKAPARTSQNRVSATSKPAASPPPPPVSSAAAAPIRSVPTAPAATARSVAVPSLNAGIGGMQDGAGGAREIQVSFDFGTPTISGGAQSAINAIASRASEGIVDVTLVARDIENFDPGKRDALIDQRLAAVARALSGKGVSPTSIRVTWRPDKSDTSIHRDGPGLQEIAKIRIQS